MANSLHPAAASYLSLLLDDSAMVTRIIDAWPASEPISYKAKDLLRAAQRPLLPASNPHVAGDLRKIRKGKPLSQVLLVRGDLHRNLLPHRHHAQQSEPKEDDQR